MSDGLPGFSARSPDGSWSGFDVDFCRAVAAAALNDPNKVEYVPLSAATRFDALRDGRIDVLSRNSTWTMSRDLGGLEFAGIAYYDGQGFMAHAVDGMTSALQLDGARVCVVTGTTTEENAATYFEANGLDVSFVRFTSRPEARMAFASNDCDVFTADVLFKGTVGGTMAPGASGFDDLRASVMRLLELPPGTRVHPGHREATTIGEEWESNPFVRIWRGLDEVGDEQVTVWGRPATLKLWAPDYDGGNKAWVVFGDDGVEAIVGEGLTKTAKVVLTNPFNVKYVGYAEGTVELCHIANFRRTYLKGTIDLTTIEASQVDEARQFELRVLNEGSRKPILWRSRYIVEP